jgi:exodeoxyribonuclease III
MTKRIPSEQEMPASTKKLKISELKPKGKGTITIASWNVGGLNACLKKGFQDYVDAEQADILLFQECKLNQDLSYLGKDLYPFQYQSHCKVKKGYSGVAMHSKIKPISVRYEIGDKEMDKEGRYIILEFDGNFNMLMVDYYVINSYIINAGAKLVRLDTKRDHYKNHLIPFLKSLKKPIIFGGDLNVCHKEIDLARPDSNHRTAGFTDEEREDFSLLLKECNLVDTVL